MTRRGQLSMWKGVAEANGARNGLFAALLAQAGMTGRTGRSRARSGCITWSARSIPG